MRLFRVARPRRLQRVEDDGHGTSLKLPFYLRAESPSRKPANPAHCRMNRRLRCRFLYVGGTTGFATLSIGKPRRALPPRHAAPALAPRQGAAAMHDGSGGEKARASVRPVPRRRTQPMMFRCHRPACPGDPVASVREHIAPVLEFGGYWGARLRGP